MPNRNCLYVLAMFAAALPAFGQAAAGKPAQAAASAQTVIPPLLLYSGQASGLNDKAPISATFLIFKDETGGEALWTETQTVGELSKYNLSHSRGAPQILSSKFVLSHLFRATCVCVELIRKRAQ